MNGISTPNAPTHADACADMGVNPQTHLMEIPQPKGAPTTFEIGPWQVIGASWLKSMEEGDIKHAILADDCGVSKTLTALTYIY